MQVPDSLSSLVAQGIVRDVIRPLMSGKEAQIYLVVTPDGLERVAKIYKDAQNRSFKHRSDYTEGRGVKSSRDQRAMNKRSSYGREKDEEAWRSAEVAMIYRLREAGVRVPEPLHFVDGVLIMELIQDEHGQPAPRLGDAKLTIDRAREIFELLLREVVRMLCADVVHGDLSDFNVLLSKDGPVVIDFPQAVDASRNPNARALLIRDVDNLTTFLGRLDPTVRGKPYGQEIWQAYELAELKPDMPLTGTFKAAVGPTDVRGVLKEIEHANHEEDMRRRAALGLPRQPRAPQEQRPAQPQGQRPAQPQGQRSAQPQGQRPAQPQGQRPARPQGQRPAQPQGQRPAQPQGRREAQLQTRPAQPQPRARTEQPQPAKVQQAQPAQAQPPGPQSATAPAPRRARPKPNYL